MSYVATVINVMIASPGDVSDERKIVRDELHLWNAVNANSRKVVFQPYGWEVQAAPDLSGRPQQLINDRILEKCDLLIGVFWTRLGTPTGEHESGTVEEIKKHVSAGRPAMVYFSSRPVIPGSYREDQYAKLLDFKAWCQSQGITNDFESVVEFSGSLRNHLSIILHDNKYLSALCEVGADNSEVLPKTETVIFSERAINLLKMAANNEDGMILRFEHLGGTSFSAGGQEIEHDGSRRSIAELESEVEKLESYGLIKDLGYKREVFAITAAGYEALYQIEGS